MVRIASPIDRLLTIVFWGPLASLRTPHAWSGRRRTTRHPSAAVEILEVRTLLSPVALVDTMRPTATITAADVTAAGGTSYRFEVQYADDVAIDVSSIGGSIVIFAPNGESLGPSLVSVNNETDGTPRTATYSMTPPGGSWTKSDNGRYSIEIETGAVSDTSGNPLALSAVARFNVNVPDLEPPSAAVSTASITLGGLGTRGVDVIYSDDGGIDIDTIDPSDIVITGPNGFIAVPVSAAVAASIFTTYPRTATYQIGAPGGIWDASDNGTYTVSLNEHAVFDTTQGSGGLVIGDREKAVPPGVIGTFDVRITPGDTFQANDTTHDNQYAPAVARDAVGNHVVVWTRENRGLNTTEILGQRFDADGNPLGGEFLIAVGVTDGPSVAMNARGDFVVAWYRSSDVSGIYVQRFDFSGNPLGVELRLTNQGVKRNVSVAMDADGDFVVVWQEGVDSNIFAQRVSANGLLQGETFRVNWSILKDQVGPSVAMSAGGDFIIAWNTLDRVRFGGDGIFAQRYNAQGQAIGTEFQVTAAPTGILDVTTNAAGASVVVWSHALFGDVYAQRFDSTGLRIGSPVLVTRNFPENLDVALDEVGNFVVTWTDLLPDSDGCGANDPTGVFARWFSASGRPHGSRVLVAGSNVGDSPTIAMTPAVAMTSEGAATIVWAQRDFYRRLPTCGGGGVIIEFDIRDPDDTDILVRQFAPVFSPDRVYVTGADAGGGPHVRVFDAATGLERSSFFAFDPAFTGGVRVATADVNGDGMPDVIAAAGPGGGPHVRVFSGVDGSELHSFWAYDPRFSGGVYVAAADLNGDNLAEIITGADAGGGPHVRVFDGATGAVLSEFFAYAPAFAGGVRVAAGDVDQDGRADIITAAGPGGGPHVRVFSGATGQQLPGPIGSFYAYDPAFGGGAFIAAADVDGDSRPDIITGAGAGGGPHVRVFRSSDGEAIRNFFAYGPEFRGGVRVAAALLSSDGPPMIIVSPGRGSIGRIRVFDPHTLAEVRSLYAFGGGEFAAGTGPATPNADEISDESGSSTAALSRQVLPRPTEFEMELDVLMSLGAPLEATNGIPVSGQTAVELTLAAIGPVLIADLDEVFAGADWLN